MTSLNDVRNRFDEVKALIAKHEEEKLQTDTAWLERHITSQQSFAGKVFSILTSIVSKSPQVKCTAEWVLEEAHLHYRDLFVNVDNVEEVATKLRDIGVASTLIDLRTLEFDVVDVAMLGVETTLRLYNVTFPELAKELQLTLDKTQWFRTATAWKVSHLFALGVKRIDEWLQEAVELGVDVIEVLRNDEPSAWQKLLVTRELVLSLCEGMTENDVVKALRWPFNQWKRLQYMRYRGTLLRK